jgi:hypothetical protein
MGEVADFEKVWNIPVVRVRNQTNSINPGSLPEVSISLHRGLLENIRPLWRRGGLKKEGKWRENTIKREKLDR